MALKKQFTSAAPAVDGDGNTYPYLMLSLSLAQRVHMGELKELIALKFTPYRIDGVTGEVVEHPDPLGTMRTYVSSSLKDAADAFPQLNAMANGVLNALSNFAAHKGF